MAACGLDFGTSNSTVALPSGEALAVDPTAPAPRLFRSVLFFPEDQEADLAGQRAIDEYLERSEGRFIQSIKGLAAVGVVHRDAHPQQALQAQDLIALFPAAHSRAGGDGGGRAARRGDARLVGGSSRPTPRPTRAPRRALRAAELAGSRRALGIEPIAAALAYEATLSRDEVVLVADFGAGTSDLTLMRLGPTRRGARDRRGDVIALDGVYIGGDRFDAAIMRGKLIKHFGAGSTYEQLDKRMPIPNHILSKLLSWHEMSFIRERATQQLIDHMLHASDNVPAIEALYDLVEENLGYRLFRAIEAAKIRLSTGEATTIDFEEARIAIHEPITRVELERFAAPLVEGLARCADGLSPALRSRPTPSTRCS